MVVWGPTGGSFEVMHSCRRFGDFCSRIFIVILFVEDIASAGFRPGPRCERRLTDDLPVGDARGDLVIRDASEEVNGMPVLSSFSTGDAVGDTAPYR